MTDFPASTRWLQTPNGAIAVKADGSVWRVQGSQHDRLCSENEWLADNPVAFSPAPVIAVKDAGTYQEFEP